MSTAIRRSLPFVASGILAIGLIAILLLSFGSRTDFLYNGKWVGHRNLAPGSDPSATYTLGWVTLTIKDEKFEMTDAGIPTSGTVDYTSRGIVLHTDAVMMLPISRSPGGSRAHPDIKVNPQKDGSLIFDNPVAVDAKPLKLTRDK